LTPIQEDASESESVRSPEPTDQMPWRAIGILVLALVLAGSYLAFVAHFALNIPTLDDWTATWIVVNSLGGHTPWMQMWDFHNVNRIFVPNLVFVGVGDATHDSVRAIMLTGAAVFIGAFLVLLGLVRSYLSRLDMLVVPLLGIVWFSVVDVGSALWSFQLAWYIIELCLVSMLYLLLVPRRSWTMFVLAVVVAVIASYSSLEGLFLWPIGLVCLLWSSDWHPARWERGVRQATILWCSTAIAVGVIYFTGYRSNPPYPGNIFPRTIQGNTGSTASFGYVAAHPLASVQFLLACLGNVVPIGGLAGRELIGGVILICAVYVALQCVRKRRMGTRVDALPFSLIAFGLLFDAFLLVGRITLGISWAVLSQYTMYNLLIVVAIMLYGYRRVRQANRRIRLVVGIAAVALVLVQAFAGTSYGISQAEKLDSHLRLEARFATTTDLVPPPERLCYAVTRLLEYVLPSFSPKFLSELRREQVNIFAPNSYVHYRAKGLPIVSACEHP
jgi:hypothetical protein